ncbi:hypothetical protein GCK72_007631 [Caenorhabditis remanei]|uniref:Uncharacterized protein n=1 Tax=Caenorhabditis remanei TaxID=31234 RepID=A0A6A5HPE2_CAERE|nr:hypothetical protein GCK72_007631 [Caenorhabditis remanei]KAF1767672.1 hypothetical protein GCK72_007631 [Caenorhabditis remanei]
MKYFLLLSIIFFVLYQSGNGCMKFKLDTTCECPDILKHYDKIKEETIPVIKKGGCKMSITCATHTNTNFLFPLYTNRGEILRPDDMMENSAYVGVADAVQFSDEAYEAPPGPPIDIISYFGVLCDGGVWYVSKYPNGIGYNMKNLTLKYIGTNGEFDGKKARIARFSW